MRDEAWLKLSRSFVTSLDDTVARMCMWRPRRSTWTFPGLPFMHFWIETSLMNAFVSVISLVISSWGINSCLSISRPNLLTVSLEHNSTCSRNIWLLSHDGNRIMGDIVALMEPITIVISPNVTKMPRHWCSKPFYISPVTCLTKSAYKVVSYRNPTLIGI